MPILRFHAEDTIALMNGDPAPPAVRTLPANILSMDAPIRDCGKLLALAGNYRAHIAEAGIETVESKEGLTPQVFWKPATCINAPGGEIAIRSNNVFVDWEIELAVVMGKRARNVRAESAMSYVFGYTIVNDISERKFNAGMANRKLRGYDAMFDWLMGKWFDGFARMGPEIVTADEIPHPHDLALRLWVNGELMQDSRTSFMIFSIPEAIAYISSVVTLEPGDIISMGTPEGVGVARGIALQPGDRIRGEVEGIGFLDNIIVGKE